MAFWGDIVSAGAAASARVQLASMVRDFRAGAVDARAVAHGWAPKGVELATLTRDQVARAIEAVATAPVIHTDDRNCAARGAFLADRINLALGLGRSGADDALGAGVAVQFARPFRKLGGQWQFHVAPVVRGPDGKLLALDPLTHAGVVPIEQWLLPGARRFRVQSPFERITGLSFGPRRIAGDRTITTMQKWLDATWEHQGEIGGTVPSRLPAALEAAAG